MGENLILRGFTTSLFMIFKSQSIYVTLKFLNIVKVWIDEHFSKYIAFCLELLEPESPKSLFLNPFALGIALSAGLNIIPFT